MKKTMIQIEDLSADLLLQKLSAIESLVETIHEKFTPQFATQLMTRQEVADHYQVSLVTIHDWLNKGWLMSYRIGNKVQFKRHEVEGAMVEIQRRRRL